MTEPVVDADTGRIVLSRGHLDVLARHDSGEEIAPDVEDELRVAGAFEGDRPHPLLVPVLDVLATMRHRGVLRRWVGGVLPVAQVLVGRAGVVVLPGGHEPEALHEVEWYPRRTSVARVLHRLLDLPARDDPPFVDRTPRRWPELVEIASDQDSRVGLADLRWGDTSPGPLASVLVVAWHRDGGIVEVTPTDGPGGMVCCTPRSPVEVWTGLTKLAR
jgi:hypothetical protein